MRILIVDDEDDFRETLRDAFEDEGYQVLVAANGVEALERMAEAASIDAVILDLIMPRLSGGEVYQAMQGDPRLADIPVIIATSDARRAPAGVKVLTKPLSLKTLFAEVARLAGPSVQS